ncbi:MAG: hypothetical protein A2Y17_00860 [Clostridiales bacterium GWF2_38_85]|nr:MAG: hypothetical protein A2Y17_00860 [Clostridiales bacterium GWF2_38_85]HBL84557.1 hypothetical protein [Clostridiales bacterium]
MYVTYERNRDEILATLHGEIDHHTAKQMRDELDKTIINEKPDTFSLVLSDISFMDSSGLGLVMGRYKTVTDNGGRMKIINPSANVTRILNMAGINKMIKIERNETK